MPVAHIFERSARAEPLFAIYYSVWRVVLSLAHCVVVILAIFYGMAVAASSADIARPVVFFSFWGLLLALLFAYPIVHFVPGFMRAIRREPYVEFRPYRLSVDDRDDHWVDPTSIVGIRETLGMIRIHDADGRLVVFGTFLMHGGAKSWRQLKALIGPEAR